ncbi:pyrokinin-1 receptor-like [Uloborus diversus]|uniref:pyrokinin-1 receptor-like n=1 Tax=Uloborus diversus TaxID=327109 RepID=UPI002409A929|nr:pyrokinin-1 receptor-like [Uloborus diversus]
MALLQNDTLSLTLNNSNFSLPSMSTFAENDSNNLTLYVFDLGPKRDSLSSVIPITVIYVLILIAGLIGNICTCVVIIRNKHMRSTTNYYLFSLAVSDLLLLVVGLPQELFLLWNKYPYIFGEAFCIIRGYTSEMSTNASILTITSFTVERYLAICHPIKAHTMSKLSRAVKLIVFLWIVSGVCAVPMAIQFGVVIKEYQGVLVYDTAECTIKHPIQDAFVSSTLCFFIIPMFIITVLYAFIGVQLRRSACMKGNHATIEGESQLNGNGSARQFSFKKLQLVKLLSRQSNNSIRGNGGSSRKAVIKMLFVFLHAFLHISSKI